MQFDLWTLPFLGGYVFYTKFSFTAYASVRAVGQHLILRSALSGFVLLLIARVLLQGAPYVVTHSDIFLANCMNVVPSCGLLAGMTLSFSTFKRDIRAPFGIPRAVWRTLISSALVAISVLVARSGPGNDWIAWGVWVCPLILLLAWTLCYYTSESFSIAVFRISWLCLLLVLVIAVSAEFGDDIADWWSKSSPLKESGAAAVALLVGCSAWYPLNLLVPYKTALERFHRLGNSDAMDRFLFDCAEASWMIQVTLTDGKFYVGKIKSLAANPLAPSSFVRVLPYASGYRNKDTKELVFTSFYEEVYVELSEEPGFSESSLDQFIKVFPFSAIFSANRFDPDIYIRFKKEESSGAVSDVLEGG